MSSSKETTKHYWGAYLHHDILTAGMFVFQRQYYDAGGMQCMACKHTVLFWEEKFREDAGKIEKRDTGKTANDLPKLGCSGSPLILAVSC